EVQCQVRELGRAPDAGRPEHEEDAGVARPEPTNRLARRARQQYQEEARGDRAADGGQKERREIVERELRGGRKASPQRHDREKRHVGAGLTRSGPLPMIARASWPTTSSSRA